ncbi:MAG TPA: nickel-binding protein [Longimicrobiales bacterium]|nr:nickel-binding protein [Longimicrobiales bacterium]
MPLFMDVHRNLDGVTSEALRAAHLKDVEVQERFNVHYHKYFFNEQTGTVFCLAEGPDAEACQAVHRAAHGLIADDIIEVQPELVEAFFATTRYDDVGAAVTTEGRPDAALRVIMFTEIADFTAVAREHEDEAARLLECHDRVVREALAAHGGHEVRHSGEGIMACFTSVSAALRAATDIQRECRRAQHPYGPRLRIGMSAGEPLAQHRDLFGAAVNTARRICEAAEPGEILVSSAVRELGMGKGSRFHKAGQRSLKDVHEEQLLYTVEWWLHLDDDPGTRPALRRAARAVGNAWSELARRRVVKVAAAYAVVLFVVLQAAELTLQPLGLPAWSYTLVLVLGLLGLPVATVLAWAFDVTPRGLERTAATPAQSSPPT